MVNLLRGDGWNVVGMNLALELVMQPGFNLRRWLTAQPRPKLVMIDLHWYEHSFGALDTARAVKSIWPGVSIVTGGLTASNFAEEILANFSMVDYIIRGDAEKPLRLMAAHLGGDNAVKLADVPNLLYRENGTPKQNARSYFAGASDLNALDFVTMVGRPAQVVEQMAQVWDRFAQAQKFRCFPVPKGW